MNLISTTTVLTASVAFVGCETSGANTGAALDDVRQAAMNACAIRADDLWSAAPGTSVANEGKQDQYGNWVLQVGTGSYRSTCTVTPSGHVIGIDPG